MPKQYAYSTDDFKRKLSRVMERLDADSFQYDWLSSKSDTLVYVEMRYKGSTYRFENCKTKSRKCGRNYDTVSDLFGSIVYSLEGLARAVEQGIFTLDMLLTGVPALPEAAKIEPCFAALNFQTIPTAQELKARYKQLAKEKHPDAGGSAEDFEALRRNYEACLELIEQEG